MARKGKDDDASFEPGDELFPLDNSSKDNGKKPPKGVKGYLKNVAKSVFNLTVKVNKTLYPEAFTLVEDSTFDDAEGNKIKIGKVINHYKTKAKDIATETKDVAKEIGKSYKDSFKSGYFVKTEDEEMDMGDMFGDLMDDDFGDFGDFGGDDFGNDDWGDSFDEEGTTSPKKKGRLSTGDAVIKSSVASTRATLRSSNRQIAATMSSTQTLIQHETALFAQQLQVDQQRHVQKMKVLKNIAHNIATTVKQNNLSIKAQMEYSAKSLAFTQDLAAMLKEVRDAQWVLTKPEEKNTQIRESKFSKILGGSGVKLGDWVRHLKDNYGENALGGIGGYLGMFGDMLNSMSDMGMKKSSLIKSMAESFILESVVKGSLSGKTKDKIDFFNIGVQGLPSALNNMFGRWSKNGAGIKDQFTKWNKSWQKNDKIPAPLKKALGFIADNSGHGDNLLKNFGQNAYLKEQIQYSSDRFKMGDPDKVHPFDNKAHKVLTEVIPAYLRKISAGVNHTGEEVYDYASDKFVPLKSVQSLIKTEQESALTYTRGYDDLESKYNNRIHDSKRNFNKEVASKAYKYLMKGFMEEGFTFDDYHMKELSKPNSDIRDRLNKYLAPLEIDKNFTDAEKNMAFKSFAKSFRDLRESNNIDDKKTFRELFVDSSAYKTRSSQTNLTTEETITKRFGDSSLYSTFMADNQSNTNVETIDERIKKNKNIIDRLDKEIKDLEGKKKGGLSVIETSLLINKRNERTKKLDEIKELEQQRKEIYKTSSLKTENVNESNFSRMEDTYNKSQKQGFNKYRLASLEDSSTHGLVQNIYNLLLSGIDVYVKKGKNEGREKYLKEAKAIGVKNYGKKLDDEKKANMMATLTPVYESTYDSFNREFKTFKGTFVTEDGEKISFDKINEKNFSNYVNDTKKLYIESNSYTAFKNNKARKLSKNYGSDDDSSWNDGAIYKNKYIGPVAKVFDKVQSIKSTIGNFILKPIYGERWVDKTNEKEIDALKNASKEVQEKIKQKIEDGGKFAKAELAKFKENPSKYVSDVAKELKEEAKDGISNIGSSITSGKDLITKKMGQGKTYLKDKATDFIHNNKAIQYINKALVDNRLLALKPSKDSNSQFKNISEAIASIQDADFQNTLLKIPTSEHKIRYLLARSSNPGYEALLPFVQPLNKLSEEVKEIKNSDGSVGNYIVNKAKKGFSKLKTKALNKVGDLLANKVFTGKMKQLGQSKAKIDDKEITFIEAMTCYANAGGTSRIQKLDNDIKEIVATYPKGGKEAVEKTIGLVEVLINEDNELAKKWLAPFNGNLQKMKSEMDFSVSGIKNMAINKAKSVGNKMLDSIKKKIFGGKESDPKKLLPGKLYEITATDGTTKLGDEIVQIAKDNGFLPILASIPSGIAKAEYLKNLKVDGLEKYKPSLGQYISDMMSGAKSKLKGAGKKLKGFLDKGSGVIDTEKIKNAGKNVKDFAKNYIEESQKLGFVAASGGVLSNAGNKGHELLDMVKNKFKKKEKENLVSGNSASEMKQAKIDAKREKKEEERDKNMKRMADALENMNKKGIALDDETKKHIDQSNEKAAFQSESKNGQGVLSTIQGFLDKTGLKNTRAGQALGKATGRVKDLLSHAGKLLPKNFPAGKLGMLKNFATSLGKIPGIGGLVGAAGGAVSTAMSIGSTALSVGRGVFNVAKSGVGLFKKLVDKLIDGPLGKFVKGQGKKIKDLLIKQVTKFAPKLGGKLAAMSTPVIGWIAWGAAAVTGFLKGVKNVKDYFKIGNGIKPDAGMTLCSGLANCLDNALFGIPSMVCGLLKKPNVAVWLYEFIGSAAAKAALERYRIYNEKRAMIFGIQSPDALAAFEARAHNTGFGGGIKNALNKAGRAIGNILTFGAMRSNDDMDAKTLGFKTVEIFKYWKEKKFEPLTNMRKDIADRLGVKLSDMDEMVKFETSDEDGDGQTDDVDGDGKADDEKAAEAQEKIQLQETFKAEYLKVCKQWVLDNNLSWLTSRTTKEMFAKHTNGKSAGEDISEKGAGGRLVDNLKKNKGAIAAGAAGMLAGGPVGAALAAFGAKVLGPKVKKAATEALKAAGTGLKNVGKTIAFGAKVLGLKLKNFGIKVANKAKEIGANIIDGAKKVFNNLKDKAKELYEKGVEKIKQILNKLIELGPIKKMLEIGKSAENLKNEILSEIKKHWKEVVPKMAAATLPGVGWVVWGVQITKGFVKGLVKAKEYFKTADGSFLNVNIGMRLCSGLANCIDEALFGIPSIIVQKLGKPNIAVWLYEKIGAKAADAARDRYRQYNLERAKVYGVTDPDALINFENRNAGDTLGEKAKAKLFRIGRAIGSFLSFGAMESNDDHDARILGFKYVKIFKYWKENKFKPLYDLRTEIANKLDVKLSDMDEMVLIDPTDTEDTEENTEGTETAKDEMNEEGQGKSDKKAEKLRESYEIQQKFRAEYLMAAKKWVVDNNLSWLNNKTTPEDFEKYTGKAAGKELSDKGALGRMGDEIKRRGQNFVNNAKSVGNFVSNTYNKVSTAAGQAIKNSKVIQATTAFFKAGAVKASEWMAKILSKYKITDSNNAKTSMEQAQAAIQNVNLNGDPNYYNTTEESNEVTGTHGTTSNLPTKPDVVQTSTSGGAEGGKGGKLYIRKNGKYIPVPENKGSPDDTNTSGSNASVLGPGKSKFGGSLSSSNKSMTEEFTGNFNKQLMEKLNILQEMHKENLRYHTVAENFFNAALQMMATIAASSGKSEISSRLNSMIGEIVR